MNLSEFPAELRDLVLSARCLPSPQIRQLSDYAEFLASKYVGPLAEEYAEDEFPAVEHAHNGPLVGATPDDEVDLGGSPYGDELANLSRVMRDSITDSVILRDPLGGHSAIGLV